MITKQGTITSAKMMNTVTVTVHQHVMHKLYKKSFRKSKKFLADTNNMEDLAIGDEVIIQECAPISKRKHFKLIEVVKRTPRVSDMKDEANVNKAMNREKVAPDMKSPSSESSKSTEASAKVDESSVSSPK